MAAAEVEVGDEVEAKVGVAHPALRGGGEGGGPRKGEGGESLPCAPPLTAVARGLRGGGTGLAMLVSMLALSAACWRTTLSCSRSCCAWLGLGLGLG